MTLSRFATIVTGMVMLPTAVAAQRSTSVPQKDTVTPPMTQADTAVMWARIRAAAARDSAGGCRMPVVKTEVPNRGRMPVVRTPSPTGDGMPVAKSSCAGVTR